MPVQTFVFRCPATGQNVQASFDGEPVVADRYIPHQCAACGRIHLVNLSLPKILSRRSTAFQSDKLPPGCSTLSVEPNIFEAPVIVDRINRKIDAFDLRSPARGSPIMLDDGSGTIFL